MTDTTADIVILGGGSGGYACALRAAELGLSVTLIDEAELGGTCLHRGCIPTKALLHAAEVADTARESESVGVHTKLEGIDMPAVLKYKDGVVARLYKGLQGLIKSRGVNVVAGRGTLTDSNTVTVNGIHYKGRNVVLATGSYARSLPGLEISGRVMTSDEALTYDQVPGSVVVLGGGVIGSEFASVWRSFGSEVTIVEALPRLLAAEDPACSKVLERTFRKRGIIMKTGVKFANAVVNDSDVTVNLEDGTSITADLLLVAVGRGPRTDGLG
ncbi:MAG: FAD-dependent oxidoreductase, partial [Actinobacteria bacterium]|nr:FAD-dependent oxidoreductase [Actinomycetota bacterium]